MKIHYKIIKKIPLDSQIVVRYFTDIANEQYFAIDTDIHGETVRSRTDYVVNIPFNSTESIEEIIKKYCPVAALEIEEKKIQTVSGDNEHKEIADNAAKISELSEGTIHTLHFPVKTDEDVKNEKIKTIDIESDILMFSVHGAREKLYASAYSAALDFKTNNYEGTVPPYIKGYMKSDATLTKEIATDNIIKKHEDAEKILLDINTNRMIAKQGCREGKEKALSTWRKYAAKTKIKIGAL